VKVFFAMVSLRNGLALKGAVRYFKIAFLLALLPWYGGWAAEPQLSKAGWDPNRVEFWLSTLNAAKTVAHWERVKEQGLLERIAETACPPVWKTRLSASQKQVAHRMVLNLKRFEKEALRTRQCAESTPESTELSRLYHQTILLRGLWGEIGNDLELSIVALFECQRTDRKAWSSHFYFLTRVLEAVAVPGPNLLRSLFISMSDASLLPFDKQVQLWQRFSKVSAQSLTVLFKDPSLSSLAQARLKSLREYFRQRHEGKPDSGAIRGFRKRESELNAVAAVLLPMLTEPINPPCPSTLNEVSGEIL
jgi:hypothetical protein